MKITDFIDTTQLGDGIAAALQALTAPLLKDVSDDLAKDGLFRQCGLLTAEAIKQNNVMLLEEGKANVAWFLKNYKLDAIEGLNSALQIGINVIGTVGFALVNAASGGLAEAIASLTKKLTGTQGEN